MKKTHSYIILLIVFLIAVSSVHAQQRVQKVASFVDKNGQLSVKGSSLINKNEEPITLKGVSFGWHNWWPRFYNEATVKWLHDDWKCNLIRAAIGVDPDNAYIQNPDFANKCLDNVVDAAIANGMYVIIDWHSHTIKTEEAKKFFTRAADKYKDYPNIIYETFNEPVVDSWADVKAYSEEIIRTIRAIDKKNIILVGTPHWDQDIHLAADNPIEGYDNIMYTLHFYAATHKQDLRDRAEYALNKGLPIFVSECAGMEASGDGAINIQEWQKWQEWMNKHRISWAAWSLADKDETCSMIKSPESPVSAWADKDLKQWGKIIRDILRKYK